MDWSGSMVANRIKFHQGLEQPQLLELYGTEETCKAAPRELGGVRDSTTPAVVAMTTALCLALMHQLPPWGAFSFRLNHRCDLVHMGDRLITAGRRWGPGLEY